MMRKLWDDSLKLLETFITSWETATLVIISAEAKVSSEKETSIIKKATEHLRLIHKKSCEDPTSLQEPLVVQAPSKEKTFSLSGLFSKRPNEGKENHPPLVLPNLDKSEKKSIDWLFEDGNFNQINAMYENLINLIMTIKSEFFCTFMHSITNDQSKKKQLSSIHAYLNTCQQFLEAFEKLIRELGVNRQLTIDHGIRKFRYISFFDGKNLVISELRRILGEDILSISPSQVQEIKKILVNYEFVDSKTTTKQDHPPLTDDIASIIMLLDPAKAGIIIHLTETLCSKHRRETNNEQFSFKITKCLIVLLICDNQIFTAEKIISLFEGFILANLDITRTEFDLYFPELFLSIDRTLELYQSSDILYPLTDHESQIKKLKFFHRLLTKENGYLPPSGTGADHIADLIKKMQEKSTMDHTESTINTFDIRHENFLEKIVQTTLAPWKELNNSTIANSDSDAEQLTL